MFMQFIKKSFRSLFSTNKVTDRESAIKELIQSKRNQALVGGGQERINHQHKKVI
jgi:hypothetical protein